MEEKFVEFEIDGLKYRISNYGNIYGIKGKLTPRKNRDGYLDVTLGYWKTRKTYRLHRLVAMYFVPNDNPETKTEVNHLDFDRCNPRADNLEWVTHEENIIYSSKYNKEVKHNSMLGSKNPRAKYTDEDVKYIRDLYDDEGRTIMEIVKILYPNYDYNQRKKEWNLIRDIAKRKSFSNVE